MKIRDYTHHRAHKIYHVNKYGIVHNLYIHRNYAGGYTIAPAYTTVDPRCCVFPPSEDSRIALRVKSYLERDWRHTSATLENFFDVWTRHNPQCFYYTPEGVYLYPRKYIDVPSW